MKEVVEEIGTDRERVLAREALASLRSGAGASLVNRTHRVVRARAEQMSARRDRIRSLWAPLAVCSSMVVILVTAVWTLLDEYDIAPMGAPDSSDQYLVLLFWFLPVSTVLLGMTWFRRGKRSRGEVA
ncbi:MAG TPA: hypothetical protein VGB69_08955 [Edaphobacter sp.]